MNDLARWAADHSPTMIMGLYAVVIVLSVWLWIVSSRMRDMQRRWTALLSNVSGHSIEKLLEDHLRERLLVESRVLSLEGRTKAAELRLDTAQRHVGLVRFDAFSDVTAQQSFALAVYDDHGDGIVLSGLTGRELTRLYCKDLKAGSSVQSLSKEEQDAINLAYRPTDRAQHHR